MATGHVGQTETAHQKARPGAQNRRYGSQRRRTPETGESPGKEKATETRKTIVLEYSIVVPVVFNVYT